jgi:hypothetical protein
MQSPKPRPTKHKNGRAKIKSNNEQKQHERMMRENNRISWVFKYLALVLRWLSPKNLFDLVEHIKSMMD